MEEKIKKILQGAKVIAVVGLSDNPERASYRVAKYLQGQGYRIIPVNPTIKEVLGERAYKSLKEIPEKVDIVDVFRRSEDVPPVAEDAINIKAGSLWMQQGIVNEDARCRAESAGMQVIMDCCIMVEHGRVSR